MRRRRLRALQRRGMVMQAAGSGISWALQRLASTFMAQTDQYAAISSQTLDRILALNGRTEYGRRCGLDGANPRRVFEKLPLSTYADYAPYIERLAAGEQNLLSSQPLVYFASTSGTTGPQKLVPVTRQQMLLNIRNLLMPFGLAIRQGILKPIRSRAMVVLTEHSGGLTSGGVPKGAAITGSFRYMGGVIDKFLTAPGDVMRVHDQATARYLQLLFALGEEQLSMIVAFFPTMLLFILRDLLTHHEALLRDLADGTLKDQLELSTDARASLRRRLIRQPARARTLAALLERDQFNVAKIWPEVGAILTASGGSFRFYIDQLRPHLGGVPVYSPVYGASEAIIGIGYSVDEPYYLMLPSATYVELVPVEEADSPGALPIPAAQATPGRCYEVVVTTLAGFTRYRMHDVVRVVGFNGQTPVIEFIERSGQVIDVLGEKTAEHHVVEAVESACEAVNARVVDYFVAPDCEHTPARYLLALEGWPDGGDHRDDVQRLVQATEAALRRSAPDYDEERELGTLAPMTAALLKPGAFERYRAQRIASGVSAAQVKMPHAVPDPGFARREFQHEVLFHVEAS
ncbi:MAG: GH3 auxin-responsive promoter family protein [Chromatiales bacterium]|nr:MAG: GH3 auxin-responsive promoter family protein [Chromatiales bacterium]